MILNPVDRYFKEQYVKEGMEKGKLEVASNLLDKGFEISEIIRVTGLSKEDILNLK